MSRDQELRSDEVKYLKDINEIAQLKARYLRCVDTKDWAGFTALVTEDFHLESDGGVKDGREEIVASLRKSLESATTIHHVHNPEITITGPDTATAIWPMNDHVIFQGEKSPYVVHGYGHYHEEYVRAEDGWRVKSCVMKRLRVDTEGELPARFAERSR